jgi:tetratricopeptide (TPR) repeat protein
MTEALESESGPEPDGAVGSISPSAAMAIGIRKGRGGDRPDPKFDVFLDRQTRLIDLQTEHLHEQRDLVISRLRWGRFSDRVKALLQVLTVLAGLVVAVGVGALAWDAWRDHAVVIGAFSVPPDLAQQGSTGAALATQLHDKLLAMRDDTRTAAVGVAVREKAVSEARVEIPETGVSLGEVNRFLHDWLGHDQQVSGEVARVTAGPDRGALVMTVRAADEPGVRLVQPDGDLDALLQKAAEHVYGAVEPFEFAMWLDTHRRAPEAIAFARAMSTKGDPERRGYGYFLIDLFSVSSLPPRQSRDLLTRSIALAPNLGVADNNLAATEGQLGHDELALQGFHRALKNRWAGLRVTDEAAADGQALIRTNIDRMTGDELGALMAFPCRVARLTSCTERGVADAFASGSVTSDWDSLIENRRWGAAQALVGLHDLGDADRIFAAPRPDFTGRPAAVRTAFDQAALMGALAAHQALEDWPAAERDVAALEKAFPGRVDSIPQRQADKALVLAHTGQTAAARRAAEALPSDCYPCLVARGRIAETFGDRAAADRWFAEAVRQGPSLPRAEEAWGRALLARGDADGALKQAQEALRKSPRFADATELEAEALMTRRDYRAAADRFAEADKLTPYWGRLHLKWGEALMLAGRYAEARRQYEIAAGLGLSRSDRAALDGLLARTASGPLHG